MDDPNQNVILYENFDLSVGLDGLIRGIQHQNPGMNITEVETLANNLLEQAGRALENGERLASIRPKPNGDFDINIWYIGPREEG